MPAADTLTYVAPAVPEAIMTRTLLAALCLSLTATVGCGGGDPADGGAGTRLNAGGSSFVNPMMSKWADEYNKAKKVEVNYQATGSGNGIQQMTAKTLDFGCTDAPMNEEQAAKCKEKGGDPVHIPLVMGAVVATYNLDEVGDAKLKFSGTVLADIYLGKIKKWNDKALADLNPGVKLPDKEIAVVQRSDSSGTTYIWTDFLSKVSPELKEKIGVSASPKWPVGVGQKGNDGVAGQVKRTPGGIGYVELIYALKSKLAFGLVKNKEGEFVEPSLESVTAAADGSLTDIPDDLRYSITDAPGKKSYPISGTVWAVLYGTQPAGRGKAVVDFLRWVTHEGQEMAAPLHYARLTKGLIDKIDKKLDGVTVGK